LITHILVLPEKLNIKGVELREDMMQLGQLIKDLQRKSYLFQKIKEIRLTRW